MSMALQADRLTDEEVVREMVLRFTAIKTGVSTRATRMLAQNEFGIKQSYLKMTSIQFGYSV